MIRTTGNRDIVVAALKHAAPYIRMFKRKVFVLKAGGELFTDSGATHALIEQIAILHQVGIRPCWSMAADRNQQKWPGHWD